MTTTTDTDTVSPAEQLAAQKQVLRDLLYTLRGAESSAIAAGWALKGLETDGCDAIEHVLRTGCSDNLNLVITQIACWIEPGDGAAGAA